MQILVSMIILKKKKYPIIKIYNLIFFFILSVLFLTIFKIIKNKKNLNENKYIIIS